MGLDRERLWGNRPYRKFYWPGEVEMTKMTDGLVEGRHVFYEDTDGTHAAIVAKVWDAVAGYVTLTVLDFNGGTFAKADVKPDPNMSPDGTVVGGIGACTIGTWRWMYAKQGTTYTPGQTPGSLEPAGKQS